MRMTSLRNVYSIAVSLAGLVLVIWGLSQFPDHDQPVMLFLLLVLAILTQSTMTAMAGGISSISVSSAISIAAVPLYGPVAAALVAAAGELGLWLISIRMDKPDWKRAVERLGVNVGMNAIAMFLAGMVFQQTVSFFSDYTFALYTLPWLVGAVVGDQVNLWLLSIIVYLAHGVRPLDVWLENRWAVPMNVAVMGIGGGLLSTAVSEFGFIGIAIFFLPILLSAYSFRVVTNKTKEQMVKLEEMVELRTTDLAKANDELETLNKEKDAFMAVLTHDMRTPLTSIKGYASVLRDREITPEQQQHIAKIILRSQDTLLEIVNNFLEVEKLQSGTPVLLEYSVFDLALLTKDAAELLETQAAEKDITFEFERVPTPVMVEADASKVERSVTNLISNAVKYTPRGGQVKVEAGANGRYAFVTIKDTGYGIPADELPHIFDRYSRVRGHQNLAVGTGLGLAIVKSFVEAHDGEILVESEVDVGSTFTIKLPLP
jgi:signal transduction histidine kinase